MIDFTAKLGHWPFRPVAGLPSLLEAMDQHEIEHAVVSSLEAVFYLNPQDGNARLMEAIAPHRARLTPFAVIRPNFTGWEDDLRRNADAFGVKGVVLLPNCHHYGLDDPRLAELAEWAAAAGMPVCIQTCMEDVRRQYFHVVPDVAPEAVEQFARTYSEVQVVALGLKVQPASRLSTPLPDNLLIDISNYETMNGLEDAVEHFGANRLLFGTHFPLFNVRANIDKLRCADLPPEVRALVSHGNAARLLAGSPLPSA